MKLFHLAFIPENRPLKYQLSNAGRKESPFGLHGAQYVALDYKIQSHDQKYGNALSDQL